FHTHSVLSSPSRLRYGRNSRAACAKTDGHSSRIPRRRRLLESTEYAAMDRMERIREGVRRRYIAASSRARLIRERDDCDSEISSKLDSKFKRLVAVLVAAFDFHSGGLSRGHVDICRRWISVRFT